MDNGLLLLFIGGAHGGGLILFIAGTGLACAGGCLMASRSFALLGLLRSKEKSTTDLPEKKAWTINLIRAGLYFALGAALVILSQALIGRLGTWLVLLSFFLGVFAYLVVRFARS
ncbi:MAG: hypothetical protein FWF11_04575 [Coriobacteriia bacterium]|nr:hypothetical protein [Coriobacteriia bacterium]